MRKLFTLSIFLLLTIMCIAQQDAMFTKYMFNSLSFNPAYAGSQGYTSIRAIYRNQWFSSIEGAPITQNITAHAPMNEKIGLGLSILNDQIGPTNTTSANVSYAYHIPFKDGKISLGLQGGIMYWRADYNKLNIKDPNDIVFEADMKPTAWLPNFGAGVYYYSEHFYAGVSVPHLINYDLRENEDTAITKWARFYRHYYFTVGGAIPINNSMILKPSLLLKNVGLFGEFNPDPNNPNFTAAPTEFDIDVSVLFYNTLWVGASFRSAIEAFVKDADGVSKSSVDSADVWAAYYLKNGIRIGVAYDYPLTKINQFSPGSFEVMLGYDFDTKLDRIVTPRYF